jgi:hypothetical protein
MIRVTTDELSRLADRRRAEREGDIYRRDRVTYSYSDLTHTCQACGRKVVGGGTCACQTQGAFEL